MRMARRLTVVLLRSVAPMLVVFMLSIPPAYAATPSVTASEWHSLQVTHNWTMNEQPQLGGERLVWQAFDGTDWEILAYDLASGSISQLTNDGIDESDPRLDGAHLVWTTQPFPPGVHLPINVPSTLSLYDFDIHTIMPIPESEGVQGSPQIAGDLVVWEAGPDSGTTDIYVYNLTTRQTRRLTNDAYRQSDPATDGRYVAFVTHPYQYSELWLFDSETGTMRKLSDAGRSTNTVGRPSVNEGRVAWVESDGRDFYLRVFDAAGDHMITATQTNDHTLAQPLRSPVIGGNTVAWLSWTNPGRQVMPHESPWSVMVADLATLAPRTIGDAFAGDLGIQSDGALLAYTSFEFGAGDVLHVYETASGQETTLDPDPEHRSSGGTAGFPTGGGRGVGMARSGGQLIGPSLAGGRVAFTAYQSVNAPYADSDIILGYQGSPPLVPAAPSPPYRVFADLTGSPYARAVDELAGQGIVRGYQQGDRLLFEPDRPVLCWQFLRMVMDATGVKWFLYNNQSPFTDTFVNGVEIDTLRRVAEAGLELGITKGTAPTRFAPYQPITRAEAITMLIRAAEAKKPGSTTAPAGFRGTLGSFSPTHADNLRRAEYLGLLEGLVGFGPVWDPWQPMTRGEAAQVLAELLDEG